VANSSSVPAQAPAWLIVGTPDDIALLPTWAEPYPALAGLVTFWNRMILEPMANKQVSTKASFMSWPAFASKVWTLRPADPANFMAGYPRAFNIDALFIPLVGAAAAACLAAGWLVWSTLGAITLLNTQSASEVTRLNDEVAKYRLLGEKSKRIESNLAQADRFVSSHRLTLGVLKKLSQKLPLEFTLTDLEVTADGQVRGTCLQVGGNGSRGQLKTSLEALALHEVKFELPSPSQVRATAPARAQDPELGESEPAASAPAPAGGPQAAPKTSRGELIPFYASLFERKKT